MQIDQFSDFLLRHSESLLDENIRIYISNTKLWKENRRCIRDKEDADTKISRLEDNVKELRGRNAKLTKEKMDDIWLLKFGFFAIILITLSLFILILCYGKMQEQDLIIAELRAENEKLRETNHKLASHFSEMATLKLGEAKNDLQDAQIMFVNSMADSMKIATMPIVVEELIVPLARFFPEWRIGYSIHNGFGAAYIRLDQQEDEYEFGIVVWNDVTIPGDFLQITCDVHPSFRFPGWTEDHLSVPKDNLYQILTDIHVSLREHALAFYATQPPEPKNETNVAFGLDFDETPEEILRNPIEDLLRSGRFEHNGC